MSRNDRRLYAVLTGDLVKSTDLPARELDRVRNHFLKRINAVKTWDKGLVAGNAEFVQGDAWQLALTIPGRALRVAIFLRAT